MAKTATPTIVDPRWRDLYKIAGVAAIISDQHVGREVDRPGKI